MHSTGRVPLTQWANVHRTVRLISIEPLSGYRMAYREDGGYVNYLPPDANDDAFGQALLEALERSRFVWPSDEPNLFRPERYMECYRNWQKDFMCRSGYKTKREAYKNMDWCWVERAAGNISFKPHKRTKPEYFRDLPPDKTVVIQATDKATIIGAALRLALNRCE